MRGRGVTIGWRHGTEAGKQTKLLV
jgi:hypothetical protein